MRGKLGWTLFAAAALCMLVGCGNPLKRDPNNVFPGSAEYDRRIAAFKYSPSEAYEIAHETAEEDNKLQFLSKKPTVISGRWYVFSMPQGSGAELQGYHVNGDNGNVKFVSQRRTVTAAK